MSALPRIIHRSLAVPGTLAGDWLRGEPRTRRLLPPVGGEEGEARNGRNGLWSGAGGRAAEAFRASNEPAAAKLRRIMAGEGGLVATGQQPVLFLGPLLVLYKALTAIAIAERLEADTGRPHLASFWIASDDHDWDEVARARLLDRGNRLRNLRLEPPAGWAARPVGRAPLPATSVGCLERLTETLPESEFVRVYLELLRDSWSPGTTIGEAFGRSLLRLLGGRDLVCVDSSAPTLKEAAAPLVRWALDESGGAEKAVEAGARSVADLGHEPPIPLVAGATPVFLDTGRARERLYRDDGAFRTGREGPRLARAEIMDRLEAEPWAFSPNVALRPVLESALLPVAATILGPGEIAYWCQLGDLFRLAGVRRPAVHPRAGWTLVEEKVDKVLRKLDLEPEGLEDGGQAAAARATRSARPGEVEEALAALRSDVGRGLERVERAVASTLPGIRSAVGKARAEAFRTVSELEGQVDARVREREEALLAQIRKAAIHLFPDGEPQERVFSPFYYLARYGPALLKAVEGATQERVAGRGEPG